MCNGVHLAHWQSQCIRELVDSKLAVPVLLIQPKDRNQKSQFDQLKSVARRIREVPFILYNRFCVKPNSQAHKKVDCRDILGSLRKIQCRTKKKGRNRERFSANDVAQVVSADLDFILRFSFGIIVGDILSAARYGIWSFHHGDNRKYRGSPPGFWEVFFGDPNTGVVLQRLDEDLGSGQVLHRGVFETQRSYTRNVENIHMRASYFPLRVCKAIAAGTKLPPKTEVCSEVFTVPSGLQLLVYAGKQLVRILRLLYRRLFYFDIWNVGVVDQTIKNILESRTIKRVSWFKSRSSRAGPLIYLADPFGYEKDSQLRVLVEEYSYKTGKGHISSMDLLDAVRPGQRKPAICLPEHLSYPFVFKGADGVPSCIPERAEAENISLFQQQPDGTWRFVRDLITGIRAIDPTYLFYHGEHWLFFTIAGGTHQLQAYYAKTLDGPWKPHALNPLKEDITCSRPAGAIFQVDDILYRPAQDATGTYGGAIRIMRLDKLSHTEFDESEYLRLLPDKDGPFPDGLHTINTVSNRVLIDGKRFRFILNGPLHRFRWKRAIRKRQAPG